VIVNSNDRPTQDPGAVGYAGDWDPGFRATYIAQRLSRIEKASVAAMRPVQTEFTSLPVTRFREAILAAKPSGELASRAQGLVRDWDGALAADSAAAAVYESWLVNMIERTFRPRLGDDLYRGYVTEARAAFALYQLVPSSDHPWFAEAPNSGARGRDALAALALEDAAAELAAAMGDDPARWSWGRLHTITFEHPLAIGPLGLLLNIGPLARPGDDDSVNDGGYDLAEPYALDAHASQRMIADLADLDASLSVTPQGQSGQPGSKYWGDQTQLWAAGDYKPMRFSRDKLGRLDGALVFRPR
jgi:penicillin amidase